MFPIQTNWINYMWFKNSLFFRYIFGQIFILLKNMEKFTLDDSLNNLDVLKEEALSPYFIKINESISEHQISPVPFFDCKETVFALDNSGSTEGESFLQQKN